MAKAGFLLYFLLLSFVLSFFNITNIEATLRDFDKMVNDDVFNARMSISIAFSTRYMKVKDRGVPETILPSEFHTILTEELPKYEKKLSQENLRILASTFARDYFYEFPIEEELTKYIRNRDVLAQAVFGLKYFAFLYLSYLGEKTNGGEEAWREIGLGFLDHYVIAEEDDLSKEIIENIILGEEESEMKINGLKSALSGVKSKFRSLTINEELALDRLSELIKVVQAKKTASGYALRYKEFFRAIKFFISSDKPAKRPYYIIEFPFDESGKGLKRVYVNGNPMELALIIRNARLFNLGNLLFYQLRTKRDSIFSDVISWSVHIEGAGEGYISIADFLKGEDPNAYRVASPHEIKPSVKQFGKSELEPELENLLKDTIDKGVNPSFDDNILNEELDIEQKEFEESDENAQIKEDVEESSREVVEKLIDNFTKDPSCKPEDRKVDGREKSVQPEQEKQIEKSILVKKTDEIIDGETRGTTIKKKNSSNETVDHILTQGGKFVVGEVGSEILLAIARGDLRDLRELSFFEIVKMWGAMSVGGTAGEGLNYLVCQTIPNKSARTLISKGGGKVLPLYFGILTYDLLTTRELKISPMQAVGVANILIGTTTSQALLALGKAIYYYNEGSKLMKIVPTSPTLVGVAKWTIPTIMDFTAIKLLGITEESLMKRGIQHKLKNRLIYAMTNLDVLIERIEKNPASVTLLDLNKAREEAYLGFFEYSLFTEPYIQELIELKLKLDNGKITKDKYDELVKRMDLDNLDISIRESKKASSLSEVEMIPYGIKEAKGNSEQKYVKLLEDPFNLLLMKRSSNRDDIRYYEHYNSIYNLISDKPLTLVAQYQDFMDSRMEKLAGILARL